MKLLVTGTTGGIGGAVAEAALAAGHEVVAFNRADFAALADGAAEIPSGLDALVFAAGCCPVASVAKTTDELLKLLFKEFISVFKPLFALSRNRNTGIVKKV